MEHGLELISPRLEILEIEVFNIIYNPGNIGNLIFLIFWSPGNIGNWIFLIFWSPGNIGNWSFLIFWSPGNIGYWILLFSHILEIRAAGGRRRAGGSRGCVVLPWIIFGTCFLEFPDILEILEICFFYILGFFQKRRAPKFHAGCTDGWAEISHMRPIQARKLKLFQTWISKWRRRRRRRPNNSPIWPEPWTITPRDQISRSGSIPHFDDLWKVHSVQVVSL